MATKMALGQIQNEIGEWSRGQFGRANYSQHEIYGCEKIPLMDLPSLLGIVEEIGELVAPIVKLHQGRYKGTPKQAHEDIKDALGDLMIFMCDFASRNNIDLTDVLTTTWNKVKNRRQTTWNEDKAKESEDDVTKEERDPKEITADLVRLACNMGWKCDDTGKLYLPNDKSMHWVAKWVTVLVGGIPVSVPHWLERRMTEVENERLGGTIIEKAMRSECNSNRVEMETASSHSKQENQEIYAQTGQGWAEHPKDVVAELLLPIRLTPVEFTLARNVATWLEGQNQQRALAMIERAERQYKQGKRE